MWLICHCGPLVFENITNRWATTLDYGCIYGQSVSSHFRTYRVFPWAIPHLKHETTECDHFSVWKNTQSMSQMVINCSNIMHVTGEDKRESLLRVNQSVMSCLGREPWAFYTYNMPITKLRKHSPSTLLSTASLQRNCTFVLLFALCVMAYHIVLNMLGHHKTCIAEVSDTK